LRTIVKHLDVKIMGNWKEWKQVSTITKRDNLYQTSSKVKQRLICVFVCICWYIRRTIYIHTCTTCTQSLLIGHVLGPWNYSISIIVLLNCSFGTCNKEICSWANIVLPESLNGVRCLSSESVQCNIGKKKYSSFTHIYNEKYCIFI